MPEVRPDPGITLRLAAWSSGLTSGDLANADLTRSKTLVLDLLRACAIGRSTPSSEAVRRLASALGGTPTSTVLVSGERLDAARAALVNGSYAHATDIDDTHVASMLHPGAAVIPAALATAELTGAEGDVLLAAIVAGYEVAVRVSRSLQPTHFRRGFQATGTCGALGAATAAARVLGLDEVATAGALGVAGSLAGGLAQFYYSGSEVKRVHAGLAAQNGVLAALLAREGVDGPQDALEGQAGFAHAYADGFPEASVIEGLGTELVIHDVVLKPHATSARLQSAVTAVCDLVSDAAIDPRSVTAVEVAIPEVIAARLTQPRPPDTTAAQMSLPFTLALVLVLCHDQGGPIAGLTQADYRAHLDDARVRRLADLVECRVDPEVSAATEQTGVVPATVSLVSGSQDRRTAHVPAPPGTGARPLTKAEHQELFRASVDGQLDPAALDRVIHAVENLHDPGALASVTQEFIVPPRNARPKERSAR